MKLLEDLPFWILAPFICMVALVIDEEIESR
jgi:hypothetical protein